MPNYTPGLDDEEDQEQPETFADPTAAPLPPPPTPQDPNVQNASYGLLAGLDPDKIDAKQLLVAQIKQAGMDQKAAQDQAAQDAELKRMEAKQMLYNRLGDRVTNLVGSFTPTPVKMEDNSTEELGKRIGSEQMMRDKLRQQLLAKSQAGVGGALKGLVDLQGKEMTQKSAQDRFVQGEAGKDRRAKLLAGAKVDAAAPGKQVPATEAAQVADLGTASQNLSDLYDAWRKNAAGTGSSISQLFKGTKANQYNDSRKSAAQVIGRALEGGKLSDMDVSRYEGMLPGPTDTEETAKNKVATIDRMIENMRQGRVDTLGQTGFNVSGIKPRTPINVSAPTSGAIAGPAGPKDPDAEAYATAHNLDYARAKAILDNRKAKAANANP